LPPRLQGKEFFLIFEKIYLKDKSLKGFNNNSPALYAGIKCLNKHCNPDMG
jgi:hypothetical protein